MAMRDSKIAGQHEMVYDESIFHIRAAQLAIPAPLPDFKNDASPFQVLQPDLLDIRLAVIIACVNLT